MAITSRSSSLQQAASAVFAVTTVVPLLVFVWTLHRLGVLSQVQSQMGLGLALGIALVGFYIFRRLMGQMSHLIQGLGRVVQHGMRPTQEPRGNGRAAGLVTEYRPPVRDHGAEPSSAEPAQLLHRSTPVPGLGMIQEVDDLNHAMAKLWMAEAAAYKGRRVALSIMNARVPLTGTLIELTHDGLLIDQDGGGQVAVSYGRLSGIDTA